MKNQEALSSDNHYYPQRGMQVLVALTICALLFTFMQPSLASAAAQILGGVAADGNLKIQVTDSGQMGVERYIAGGWVSQIFSSSPGSKGSKLYINGTEIKLGYYDGAQATNTGNSLSGNTITTSWTASGTNITQKTTYANGNAYYRLEWTITNTSGSTLSDLRFFHGEDTYLLGGDNGAGFWDAVNNSIGVKKPDLNSVEQRMTLQGITPPFGYDSEQYSTASTNAENNALTNTIDANVATDNGYAMEWRTPSLAPGASWTIIAFEKFNNADATGLSVTAPVSIDCQAGNTCTMNYSVQNVGSSSSSVSLWLTGGPGWGETITSPSSPVTIGAGALQSVTVQVSVPVGTSGGTTANITLNASDGTNTSSDTGGVYVPIPPDIAPTAFTSGAPASGTYGAPYTHTFSANGTPAPTFSIISGSFPTGLTLDGTTGVLSGTPTAAGSYTFGVRAGNSAGTYDKTFSINIDKATPTVSISTDPAIPTYPQNFDVTVTVSSSAGTPGGTVNIGDGSNSCSGVALVAGSASCTFVANAAGNRTITASYSGNGNFKSASNTAPLTIQKGAATVTAAFDSFTTTNTAAFKFNGDAKVNTTTHTIELTRNVGTLYGTAWWMQKVNLGNQRSFSTLFSFFMRNGSSLPADGLTFAIQTQSNSAGASGGGLGLQNIQPSFGIEYDTYYNTDTDPDANHVGIDVNGNVDSIWTTTPSVDLNNGTTYHSWVDYDGSTDTLQIRLGTSTDRSAATVLYDGTVASQNGGTPLYNIVGADVYVGFTAATGGENQEHHIGSFYFNNDYIPGGIQTTNISYATHPATITLNSSPTNLYAASPMTTGATHSTITVCTLDASGTGMANETVALSTSDGTLGSTSLITGENGCSTTTLTASATIGSAAIHASVAGGVTNSIDVEFLPTPPTAFLSSNPPDSVYWASYSHTFAANGYYTPTYTVASGSLPTGLSLNSTTGVLSGTPSVPGTYIFTLRATNTGGTHDQQYTIFIDKASTHLDLVPSINPSVYGNNVTYTATLSVLAPSLAAPVGPVQLAIDAVNVGSPISLNGSGVGARTVPYTSLWPNNHPVQASYAGTANFKTSSASLTQTVQKATPILTLTPSAASMTYGESFAVDITLAANPTSIGIPSGSVGILLNGVPFGDPLTLDADGKAQANGLKLPVGSNTVTLNYSGDDYFAGVSDPISNPVTVNQAHTTTTLTGFNPANLVVGQPTTISVTVAPVAPGAGDPTGTVTVSNGSRTCNVTLAANNHGQGSCALTPTATGNPNLTATYAGDSNFVASTAGSIVGPVVNKADARFSAHGFVAGNSVVVGQAAAVSVTLGAAAPGSGIPSGTVTVSNGTVSCEITLDASGTGSCNLTPKGTGNASLTWTYSGDTRFNELVVTDPSTVLEVSKANTSTTLVSSDDSSVYGQPVTFTASVAISAPGAGSLDGQVQFVIDGQPFGDMVDLVDGHATSNSIGNLSVTGHIVTAQYLNDPNFNNSTSGNLTQTVAIAASTLRVESATNPSKYGNPVTVTAFVEPVSPSEAIPTGSVQFVMNGVNYGAPIPLNGQGEAIKILPYTALWPGNHLVTAVYTGDSHFSGSNNNATPLTQVVNNGQVQITLNPAAQITLNGQAVSFNATVTGAGSNTPKPSGTVQFSVDDANLGGPVTLDSTGKATSAEISSLSNGSHNVTVVYAGDEYYQSHSTDFTGAVMVTQTVTSFGGGTPAHGTYGVPYSHTFSANGFPAASFTVSSGSLPPGLSLNGTSGVLSGKPTATNPYTFNIKADNGYTSITQEYTLTVDKAATTVTLDNLYRFVLAGEAFSFSATVSPVLPGTLTPGGSVQFTLDGENFGAPVDPDAEGKATSQITTSLDVDTHTFGATYLGDENNHGSTSAQGSLNVSQSTSTISVVSSAPTSVFGQPVHFTATVQPQDPSIVFPQGKVQFNLDGEDFGPEVPLTDGHAVSQAISTLSIGSHTFSAEYLGDSHNIGSTTLSPDSTQEVQKAPTGVVITSSLTPAVYGTSVDMTVTVEANPPSVAVPAGSVQLSIDGVIFGSPMILDENSEAVRTVPYLNLWPGHHAITAVYTPEVVAGQFLGSDNTEDPLDQQIDKADPIFTITPSIDAPLASESMTYTILVAHTMDTQGTPKGTVRLFVDDEAVGSLLPLDSQGRVTTAPVKLGAGSHAITVSYSGDDYFLTIPASPALDLTVGKVSTTTQIVSVTPSSAVVGQPVTVQIQVTPQGTAPSNLSGTVTVSHGSDTCGAALATDGTGSCQLVSTAPGSPVNLTASYPGTQDYVGSTSSSFSDFSVAKADSQVAVTSFSTNDPVVGEVVTILVKVAPLSPGFANPTGSVDVSDGAGHSCTAALTDGAGSCELAFASARIASLQLSYSGNGSLNESELGPFAGPTVEKAETSVEIDSSADSSVFGEPVSFTATLSVPGPGSGSPTGAVQFKVDGVDLGSPVTLIGGSATSPDLSTLAVGQHTYSAAYLGDDNFASSEAPAGELTVSKAGSSIVVTTDVNPSTYGIPVLAIATVTQAEPSQVTPANGVVQFVVDGVNYGAPVPLDTAGHASKLLPYTALWVGSHKITVFYHSSASFNNSDNTLSPYTQVVNKGLLTITLAVSAEYPVFGQPISFTAGVMPTAEIDPVPTGTLQFAVDGANLGSLASLDLTGSATSATVSSLAVGSHKITLTYSGDDYYKPTTLDIDPGAVIYPADAEASITSFDPEAAVVGEPVTIYFQVSAVAPGDGTPGGEVTITNGADQCSGTLDEEGTGSCDLIPSATGSPDLQLSFAGDGSFNPSTPEETTPGPEIGPANTTITSIEADPTDPVVGQPYTVTVHVSSDEPSTTVPHGSVTISNGTDNCTAPVEEDGSASCTILPTGSGNPDLTAKFTGDSGYNDSPEKTGAGPDVGAATTLVSLALLDNPAIPSRPTQFTVAVEVQSPGGGTPTGQVQFQIDGEDYGDAVDLANGEASSLQVSDLSLGLHAITALYLGSSDYTASVSDSASLNVVEGSTLGVLEPNHATIHTFSGTQDGQPVSFTIEVPEGAVDAETTLVFRQLESSDFSKPDGKDFASLFTLEAYRDGELQSSFQFNQPITITIAYALNHWKESTLDLDYWAGSAWADDGVQMISQDWEQHTVTATIAHLSEFALIGAHEYVYYFPFVYVEGSSGQ